VALLAHPDADADDCDVWCVTNIPPQVEMPPLSDTPDTPHTRRPLAGHQKLFVGGGALGIVIIGACILALPAPSDGRNVPLPVVTVALPTPRVADAPVSPRDSIIPASVTAVAPASVVAVTKPRTPVTQPPQNAIQPSGSARQSSALKAKTAVKAPAVAKTRESQATTKTAPKTAGRAVDAAVAETPPAARSRPVRVVSACEEHYVAQDWAAAFDACSTEATRGTRTAQRRLAVLYLDGRGTKRNEQEAVRLFTDAATAGDTDAMFQLADALARGRGTRKDEAGAVRWYEKAGDGGIAAAQYALGQAYERGRLGLKKDKGQAITWYQRAANEGFGDAAKKVRDLSK